MIKTLKVEIRLAWWFRRLYLPGVIGMALLTGLEPNMDKVRAWGRRATRTRMVAV